MKVVKSNYYFTVVVAFVVVVVVVLYLQKFQAVIGLDAVLNFEASTQTVLERASKQGTS